MSEQTRAPWRPIAAGPFDLATICQHIGLPVPVGKGGITFTDIKPLYSAEELHLSFLDNQLYKHGARTTRAGAVLVRAEDAHALPEGTLAIVTTQPYVAFAAAMQLFYPRETPEPGRNQTTMVAESAKLHPTARLEPGVIVYPGAIIGARVHVGAYTVIGNGVSIGEGTVIGPHCTLNKCTMGANCVIHPGVAIGQDGFGFAMLNDRILKVPQVGGVIIGDEVEIGAHTTIDCGALEDTVIGDMVKIDNQVQVGHNVKIGKGTRIVSQVGIAGSASIGEYNVIGGQSGIVGHISTAAKVMVAARSGVSKGISEPGTVVAGTPAKPIRDWKRELAVVSRLTKNASEKPSSSEGGSDDDA
ncbi:MAG TPA: UDP-3-O-(3-hydroxymyristoyl)glucosamine N-acyltransferase [Alphaproteobacteria bacterium]|nr:UDP-3-O-(3-hydroxymyristoyl)glucosamine N-acyltransferase [Alphaproteobacteria bacterium]